MSEAIWKWVGMVWRKARGVLAFVIPFALGIYVQEAGIFSAIVDLREDIFFLAGQQLFIAGVSSCLAILVAVPLGVLLTRRRFRRYGNLVSQVINLGTTVPTLAILALFMTFLGIGQLPAIFGLFLLTLLPILLNTISGIRSVPVFLIDSARSLGMTDCQILLRVELPNAFFVILAGIRTALAINIGSAPLAFLIGGGGLGELIFTGIDLMEPAMLLAGAVPTALLAIGIDFIVGQVQYWLIPRGVNPFR